MTKPPLTVHNAAISTARVEIKTLTVSGRQVTLAVFRQLREAPVIEDDGVLAGQLWGVVNYHPDKCADLPEHWHVVWQRDADLLRSLVYRTIDHGEFWPESGDRLVTAAVYEYAVHGTTGPFKDLPLRDLVREYFESSADSRPGIVEKWSGLPVRMTPTDGGQRVVLALLDHQRAHKLAQQRADDPWHQDQRQAAERALAAQITLLGEEIAEYGADMEQLLAECRADVAAEAARRERHAQARQAITELPQLFIAV
ncbi:hypothetical protein [Actinoplanes siamensis]|uniref:Uncharacterized protein n=1 Tax=Actinoplanes siamensis TaxID=1223317 RepID=A0A919NE36_9ACTN|nr:hypothetical protein [Actinoplanes siamensis]GIF08910.1 hypothetical protein Asi03nite_64480 [Actinoplanes siamensis]